MDTLSVYTFDTTLANIKETVDGWIKEYGPDARIDYCATGFDRYDDSPQYSIQVDREETDEEQAIRISREERNKIEQDGRDRAEFERLAQKFKDKK
jgi:hypothetical protein